MLLASLILGASLVAAVPSPSADESVADKCAGLAKQASKLIPGYKSEVYAAQVYPKGTNFSTPDASPAYKTPVPNLAAFCRFGSVVNTSTTSQIRFEVWMPTETWNNRFAHVGNGGDAGGVNYPDMGVPLTKYGFAVASTDAGHNGTSADGSFALNGPQTQYDFGYRAVHLSTIFSKNVVKAFYGKTPKKNYWIGCSSGGKQGLKEVETYPEDFDGALTGSPAWWWPHLNGYTVQSNLLNQPSNPGYVNVSDWLTIHAGILEQCDAIDGLADGTIANPQLCHPDFSKINITAAQRKVAASVYQNWTDTDGNLLFPGFSPGSEYNAPVSFVLGSAFGPGPDFFKYQVLNYTSVAAAANVTFTTPELVKLVKEADKTNPGNTNANNFNINPFFKRGGKLLGYTGSADWLIAYGSSLYYHQQVIDAIGRDPRESFRWFTVPGMGHCSGGNSAYGFGQASQKDMSISGTSQSSVFDADHDAILALMRWVEKGTAPEKIISTAYINNNASMGVNYTRPLCPLPQFGHYVKGNTSSASSFICK